MKRRKSLTLIRLVLFLVFSVVGVTLMLSFVSSDLPKVAGAKITVHGKGLVQVKEPDKEWTVANDGDQIIVGTEVKTDQLSSAEITYKTGTVTQLDNNTEITLRNLTDSPAKILVSLEKGRVWSRVVKLANGESYQTQTKTTTTTVHGTAYSHEILPSGEDRVIVTESTVAVSCRGEDTPEEKEVNAGNMLTADCFKQFFAQKTPENITKQVSSYESLKTTQPQVQGAQTVNQNYFLDTPYQDFQTSQPSTPAPTAVSTPRATSTPTPRPNNSNSANHTPTPTPTPVTVSHPPAASPTGTQAPTISPQDSKPDYCHPPYKGGKPEECK